MLTEISSQALAANASLQFLTTVLYKGGDTSNLAQARINHGTDEGDAQTVALEILMLTLSSVVATYIKEGPLSAADLTNLAVKHAVVVGNIAEALGTSIERIVEMARLSVTPPEGSA